MRHLKKYNENQEGPYSGMREVEPGIWRNEEDLRREYDEKRMKQWVVTTQSESGDHYIYLIEHPSEPTSEELERFLMVYGVDKDEDRTYENIDSCVQITKFQRIPR